MLFAVVCFIYYNDFPVFVKGDVEKNNFSGIFLKKNSLPYLLLFLAERNTVTQSKCLCRA